MSTYTSTFEYQINDLIAAEFEARVYFTMHGGRSQIGEIEIGAVNPETNDIEYQDSKHTPDDLRFQVIADMDANSIHDDRMYEIWRTDKFDELADFKRDHLKDRQMDAAQ